MLVVARGAVLALTSETKSDRAMARGLVERSARGSGRATGGGSAGATGLGSAATLAGSSDSSSGEATAEVMGSVSVAGTVDPWVR